MRTLPPTSLLLGAALCCFVPNARAEEASFLPPRVSLNVGFGAAHAVLGPQLDLILGHFAVSAGLGLIDFPFSEYTNDPEAHVSPAFGLRWFRGNGDGLYVSAHVAFFSADVRGGTVLEHETRRRTVFGLTVGNRFRFDDHWFADLGIGVAIQRLHWYGRRDIVTGLQYFDEVHVRAGFIWGVPSPDVDVAIGFQF